MQACAAASEPHRDVADAFGGAGEMPPSAEGTRHAATAPGLRPQLPDGFVTPALAAGAAPGALGRRGAAGPMARRGCVGAAWRRKEGEKRWKTTLKRSNCGRCRPGSRLAGRGAGDTRPGPGFVQAPAEPARLGGTRKVGPAAGGSGSWPRRASEACPQLGGGGGEPVAPGGCRPRPVVSPQHGSWRVREGGGCRGPAPLPV